MALHAALILGIFFDKLFKCFLGFAVPHHLGIVQAFRAVIRFFVQPVTFIQYILFIPAINLDCPLADTNDGFAVSIADRELRPPDTGRHGGGDDIHVLSFQFLYLKIRDFKNIKLSGIYTHFSCADNDPDYTLNQRKLFLDVFNRLPDIVDAGLMVHADNSAGLETFTQDSPFNAVRIGLLQFGLLPYPNSLLKAIHTEPVMSFETRVSLVKNLPKGTGISYSVTYKLKRNSRIAILTAGYGDGIPTSISNQAYVLIRGKKSPVIGRVTMDQTIVDVTDIPGVETGDVATLIGTQGEKIIGIAEFASWAQSIPWEIFCSITKRVPRIYHTDRSL